MLIGASRLGMVPALAAGAAVALIATVFAAVYHAELVAHRVGEPFGTLVVAYPATPEIVERANRFYAETSLSTEVLGYVA